MKKESLNLNVTEADLLLIMESLEQLNEKLNKTSLDIFKNETERKLLSKPSHFVFSIVHRSIELNRAFKILAEDNNWITAINLLRLQADNCMRIFALSLVEDRLDFCNRIEKGEHIKKIKDAEGNEMSDFYLSQKLDTLYPGFRLLYENSSGFIHFSNEHMKINTDIIEYKNQYVMKIRLGETSEFSVIKKIDFAFNMLKVSKEFYSLLNGYKLSMIDFMKKFD